MDPALVVRTLVDAINDCNWVAIGQVLTPGFRRHSLAAGAKGLQSVAEFIEFLKAERSASHSTRDEIGCRGVKNERRAGISSQEHLPPSLLRLRVGIENVEDLWADLDAALRKLV